MRQFRTMESALDRGPGPCYVRDLLKPLDFTPGSDFGPEHHRSDEHRTLSVDHGFEVHVLFPILIASKGDWSTIFVVTRIQRLGHNLLPHQ